MEMAHVKRTYTKVHLIKKKNKYDIITETGANLGRVIVDKSHFIITLKGNASQVKGVISSGILSSIPGLD